jgi:hypothetical protein
MLTACSGSGFARTLEVTKDIDGDECIRSTHNGRRSGK